MRKYISLVLAILCFLSMLCFVGCVEKKDEKEVNVNLADVLSDINNKFSITDEEMMKIEDTDSLELYYNIAPDDVKQFAAETTVNAAEDISEIILVEAVDSDAAQRVFDALDVRYNSQKDLCASYSAELLDIIKRCSVTKNGNYVTLIMSRESAEITDFYNSYFD